MSSHGRLVAVSQWLCLTIWLAVLTTAAIAAFCTFSVLPKLDITVAGLPWSESAEHGRYAAGKVMEPLFFLVDLMQMIAGGGLLVTMLARAIMQDPPWRGALGILRTIAIVMAIGSFVGRAALLTPDMNRELQARWTAAEAGDQAAADEHGAAFDELHPKASRLYQITLIAVFASIILTAAADTPPRRRPERREPELLHRRRGG